MTTGIVDGVDWYAETCARCEFAYDVHDGSDFRWAYCRRFPPKDKGKFPRVDPYYTRCGEFKNKETHK